MAAAPDDDARRTLAELEAKLRELERELLRGYEPEGIEADPFAAPKEPAVERAPEPAAFPPAAAEPEPAAFDAAEWATPDTREDAQPEATDEPAPTYDGGLGREPLPDYESVEADEAEPAA